MKILSITILFLVSFSGYTMRCGNDLINPGDTIVKLMVKCGKPLYETPDHLYFNLGDGMLTTVKISHDIVETINYQRGQL